MTENLIVDDELWGVESGENGCPAAEGAVAGNGDDLPGEFITAGGAASPGKALRLTISRRYADESNGTWGRLRDTAEGNHAAP